MPPKRTDASLPAAIRKMEEARQNILKAEALLMSVTSEELEDAGCGHHAAVPTLSRAVSALYEVYGHATALKIVRDHLWTEFLA